MSVDILDHVFDAYAGEMGQKFMRETQRRIHWMCAAVRGQTVLDVGCSQGLVPILLGREGKTAVGIDNSNASIRSAEQHLASEQAGVRKLVSFIEGDAVTYPFGAAARFDCIVMGEVLEHLLQPERFIEVAARLLDPGSRLIVTVPFGINDHPDHKRTFYLREPLRLLADHFEITDVTIFGGWLGLIAERRAAEGVAATPTWSDEQLQRLESAFNELERKLVDEAADLKTKLEAANAKYRTSNEEIARLKRETAHQESERKAAERARTQLEQQLAARPTSTPNEARENELRAQLEGLGREASSLRDQLGSQREALSAREVSTARLEERLVHAGHVRELELAARDAEIERTKAAKAEVEERAHTLLQRAKLAEDAFNRQALRHADELGGLRRDLEEHVRTAQGHASREGALKSRLDEATAQYTEQTRLLEPLRATIERLQSNLAARDVELKELRLTQAQDRANADKAAPLTRELDALRQSYRELERSSEQWRQQLLDASQAERRATQRLEQSTRGKAAAERKVIDTRNTLSFQLGYELIHGFKSKDRLRKLPSALWALQKEAERRRNDKTSREHRLSPPPAPALQQSTRDRSAAPERTTGRSAPTAAAKAGGGSGSGSRGQGDPPPAPAKVTSVLAARPEPLRASPSSLRNRVARAPAGPLATSTLPAPPTLLSGGLSQLRVACIHDEFTFSSFAPDCQLQQLTPEHFRDELQAFTPDLLFVESAWRGKDELWGKRISHRSNELAEVVEWCRARKIPTVFWNKEDPVHFATFLNTAKLFDFVFTTDLDCVHRYRQALGHERVYLLPFACQPATHNPIEKYQRKDAICFAGAYYVRYPERQRDLQSFALSFTNAPKLEIYDRNFGKTDPNYAFPEEYRQFIVGTLPFDEIDRAYKGYRYALNLNSIKESQTMFARRVYELLASNTLTVSNFSRGVRLLFGDLVITTDSGSRALERLRELAIVEPDSRRLRLLGLRKVLQEHTYQERLRFIASRVWGRELPTPTPGICVLARANTAAELRSVLENFARQTYAKKQLCLVAPAEVTVDERSLPAGTRRLLPSAAQGLKLSDVVSEGELLCSLAAQDFYGASYLLDLVLATQYSTARAIGKRARYTSDGYSSPTLRDDGAQYRPTTSLPARACLLHRELIGAELLDHWLATLADRQVEAAGLAIDEFNYCEDAAELNQAQLREVSDLTGVDLGLSLAELTRACETHGESIPASEPVRSINSERLALLFKPGGGKAFTFALENQGLLVQSALPDGTHEYVYANELWSPAELGYPKSNRFHLDVTPGLNLHVVFVFLDQSKQKLGNKVVPAGRNESVDLPDGTAFVQLGLRIYGTGSSHIKGLLLDHLVELPETLFGRSDYLLLTNHYPADHDLYRNAFVHRRIVDYRKQGTRVDVFRHRGGEKLGYSEFDGVDVINGDSDALAALLRSNDYKAIMVHFLDAQMWQVLRKEAPNARPLIWLHGAEIQSFRRRSFISYDSDAARDKAKLKSTQREDFWRGVMKELPDDGKLIFVSRQFAEQTLQDLGLPTQHDKCTVIHNLIDGELFQYRAKSVEQRKRVLSIRPFASPKYANDLTAAAILELSKEHIFKDLFFHIIGDGPLFESTVEPLRGFSNVKIERGFVTQQQIAELHRDYGVFLCPTRDDTQGVSRDEAMASGLVPITSNIGAIPEFVDENCAILAEPESSSGLAAGIRRLYQEPALFVDLSEAAARRVRRQSSSQQTTQRELELILRP